jgi:epidermal growth factor receptor substrate 15
VPTPSATGFQAPIRAPIQAPIPTPIPAQIPVQITAQNSGAIRVPPLAPERVAEYARLFERAGGQNGLLQGT